VGRQQGLTEEKLKALADFENSAALSEVEKLVLRYAVEMTRTPVDVPDDLFAQLRSHFNERQLIELTSAIAWENYRARFDHALGVEAEGFSEGAFCPIGSPPT
jgi:alkylhydroperoxidase family enzyme